MCMFFETVMSVYLLIGINDKECKEQDCFNSKEEKCHIYQDGEKYRQVMASLLLGNTYHSRNCIHETNI